MLLGDWVLLWNLRCRLARVGHLLLPPLARETAGVLGLGARHGHSGLRWRRLPQPGAFVGSRLPGTREVLVYLCTGVLGYWGTGVLPGYCTGVGCLNPAHAAASWLIPTPQKILVFLFM